MVIKHDEPCFTIGVVHQMLGLHPQTLRHYERLGLVRPHRAEPKAPSKPKKSRSGTRSRSKPHEGIRMYSAKDLERIALIKRWIDEFGVNLAGVEIMLKMTEQMDQMRDEMEREMESMREQYEGEVQRLKDALLRVTRDRR